MPSLVEVRLCCGSAGWYVEWFKEDQRAPLGYRAAQWYGERDDCVARMREPAPVLRPVLDEAERSYMSAAVE
jgi:hypothetical protein